MVPISPCLRVCFFYHQTPTTVDCQKLLLREMFFQFVKNSLHCRIMQRLDTLIDTVHHFTKIRLRSPEIASTIEYCYEDFPIFLFCDYLVPYGDRIKVKGSVYLNVLPLSLPGMCFQNRSNQVAINISNMLNGNRCSYGRSVQIAVPSSKRTIYMRDDFLHQIRKMALSISCWAIYLTSIDEFIMVTIPIMKCHPKIGPCLDWRAEISSSIILNFTPWENHLSSAGLILFNTLLCLEYSLTSKWDENVPLQQTLFSLISPLTGLDKDRKLWSKLVMDWTCIISTN